MSLQPQHDRGDRDHRQIVHLTLLVAGRDPAELLEPIDRPLHPVTLPVRGLVEAALAGLVGLGRDHRPDPTAPQIPPDARVAVALVTGHRVRPDPRPAPDRKSTRLNSSHPSISYAVFCLKKKKQNQTSFHVLKNKKKQEK